MSTDSTGKVAYGIPSTDDYNIREKLESDDGDFDWENAYYEKKSGLAYPNFDTQREEWNKWIADKRSFLNQCPVDLMLSGSDYELAENIVIKSTRLSAAWGEIVPIKSLETKPEWDEAIKDFCETMGLEYRQPIWFLTSLYF